MCRQSQSRCNNSQAQSDVVLSESAASQLASAFREMDKLLCSPDENDGLVHMVTMLKHLRKVRQYIRTHQAKSD